MSGYDFWIKGYVNSLPAQAGHACNCVGPQPGKPRCPCMMRGIIERDGRWVEPERDLGPVRPGSGFVLADAAPIKSQKE